MELNELMAKFSQGKKGETKETPEVNQLIKFKEGVLDKYPKVNLKIIVYPSSFGIHKVAKAKEADKKALMEGEISIYSDEENLLYLCEQLQNTEKKTELDKYKRIKYQSDIITDYRKKNMDEEFINNMLLTMPIEYEVQITITPKRSDKLKAETIKIYTDNLDDANKLEKSLEIFRETALSNILEETISAINKENALVNSIVKMSA